MPPPMIWRSTLLSAMLIAIGAQAQTEDPQDILISGESLVPIDTDDTPGPSEGDSGYEVLFVPGGNDGQDCFAVVGTGVFEDTGEQSMGGGTTFNFQQVSGDESAVALEEIPICGDYYDGRQRRYAGTLSNDSVAKNTPAGFTFLLIQRETFAPGSPLAPAGSGELVDTDGDGIFDSVVGTMSDGSGMNLSVLMDLDYYPDADNPTHLVLPAVMDRADGTRGFFSAYIPMNPDFTITAVNATTGDPVGGVGLLDGVTVGELPRGIGAGPGPVAIPLLSRWGMAGLMLVLLGVTVAGMRRLRP